MAILFDAGLGLRVRNAGYRSALKGWDEAISMQTATSDLGAMVRKGLLQMRGQKNGAYYTASGPLAELRTRIVKGRQPIDVRDLFVPSRSPNATESDGPLP